MCPCRALTNVFSFGFLFLFVSYFGVLYFFWDVWVLRDPTFSAKKINKNNNLRERLGKVILNTCAKFQGLTLKIGVDIWTFVRLSAKITAWHRNYLILVFIRFLALNLT